MSRALDAAALAGPDAGRHSARDATAVGRLRLRVAVIGGGWSGLSAAFRLHQAGADVTVHEASHTLGGRARRVAAPGLQAEIDNGQHLLLGAYTETLGLMHDLGLDPSRRLRRIPLTLQTADGAFRLRAAPLPAPWHLVSAIATARGLGWQHKWRLTLALTALRRNGWRVPPGMTVAQWLTLARQPPALVRLLWQPLCLSAMNTPIDQACAQLFANVLRDSTGAQAWASDFLLPGLDLTRLWPEALPVGISVRLGCAVRQLAPHSRPDTAGQTTHGILLDGCPYDAVIVATNTPSALRLLSTLPSSEDAVSLLGKLRAFQFRPIATLTLRLASSWPLPFPMLQLQDDPARGHHGQWVFDHGRLRTDLSTDPTLLTIVVSDAQALSDQPEQAVVDGIVAQLRQQVRGTTHPMPDVAAHRLIIEKRATFTAAPGLARPASHTPWPGVWLAGDWTDTGYPAVLEGAVRSGKAAALALLAAHPNMR